MSSINKVILIGRLGRDPEIRYTAEKTPIVNASLATSQKWRDKQSGEMKEETEWHNIILFGRQAEVAEQYLKKGSLIYIEGRLKTRKYTAKDGIDRYTTEVVADTLQMLGSKSDNLEQDNSDFSSPAKSASSQRTSNQSQNAYAQAKAGSTRQAQLSASAKGIDDMDEDPPF